MTNLAAWSEGYAQPGATWAQDDFGPGHSFSSVGPLMVPGGKIVFDVYGADEKQREAIAAIYASWLAGPSYEPLVLPYGCEFKPA